MKTFPFLSTLLLSIFMLSACSDTGSSTYTYDETTPEYGLPAEENSGNSGFVSQSEKKAGGFIPMTDPKEGAFTVLMPKGWKSQVGLERPEGQIRSCGVATSADGSSRIFFGDPSLPTFMNPMPQFEFNEGTPTGSRMTVVLSFKPAEQFLPDYVKRGYGQKPGFRITRTSPNPAYKQFVTSKLRELGINAQVTAAKVIFEFQQGGKRVRGKMNASTINMESVWSAEVNGFTTSSDPAAVDKILTTIIKSHKTNPQWLQKERARAQQQMAQQNANHQQRMKNMQQNFNAHQNMMKQRYDAADAQNQQWRDNQAAQDQQHDQYIDYLRDETTITNGTESRKVESGYNNYYVDPTTDEYIGTDSYDNPDPGRYEEWEEEW